MKHILIIISGLILSLNLLSQAPSRFNYQAVVRDSLEQLVSNAPIGIRISIMEGSSSGAIVYQERHDALSNTNGLFSIEVGTGSEANGVFSDIEWGIHEYYYLVEIDILGGTNYALSSTHPFNSVPYSLFSSSAAFALNDNVDDADADPTNELQTLSVSAAGDTLYLQNGGFVIIPGISVANTPVQLATLTTSAVSSLTNISATSGGNITDDGGANITTRGVCYSINTNPTTADNITNDGNGTGSFTSNLSGLTTSTTYYVRAYATNSAGTAYGNELSFTTPAALAIGDSYQGGIIFYLDGSGGGLIAAPSDQSTAAEWGCMGTGITGADGTAIGTGVQNTIDIEAGCTTIGTAADICANLVLAGYTDWFLPSKDELDLMYQNKATIDATAGANGGSLFSSSSSYWSSTESNNFFAWRQYFFDGNQDDFLNVKNVTFRVRAVRAF